VTTVDGWCRDRHAVTDQEPGVGHQRARHRQGKTEDHDGWCTRCDCSRSWSGRLSDRLGKPSRLRLGDSRSGSCGDALEVPPPTPGYGFSGVIGRVVIVELSLAFLRHEPKNAQVPIGHDRRPLRSGIGRETATASGSERGTSSSLNRRKPNASSKPDIVWGGSPHCGQATRYAAAAGVKRNRHSEQQTWVIADRSS
jgi:hypothetical protein